jgi:hypothetical protein
MTESSAGAVYSLITISFLPDGISILPFPNNEVLFTVLILVQLTNTSCLPSNAFCKSVWSLNVPVIFHHSALVCVLEITQLVISIPVQAVYVVSVALIVQSCAIVILAQAVNVSCFDDNAVST